MEMEVSHSLGRCRPDRGDPRAPDLSAVVVQLEEQTEKRLDPVNAGENDPIILVSILNQFGESPEIGRRFDPDSRKRDNVRPKITQLCTQRSSLFPCPGNHDS